ncbi:hypothetical protein [Planktothricoides sp. SR001]|uniref:hypothetical protein n=1 Tax=Planktothricoides sp. SR001 TaxID=1705388 RepID=UPI001E4440AE|nr:hypothetical protein [Planktothricoides sp. SR001]
MTPEFFAVIEKHFPGTLLLEEYMKKTFDVLQNYGFESENTMGMVALCRDEITEPLFNEVVKYWGKTFNCCSLGGFLTIGRTGINAAAAHTPIYDGMRRFTFYGMPHIAISRYGEIGKVYRHGIDKPSHACGSLELIVNELNRGHFNMILDLEDLEESLIRQKLLSHIKYGSKPDLIKMTKLACNIISIDINNLLLKQLSPNIFNYAVMTGIMIHGLLDSNWVYPRDFYVVGENFPHQLEKIKTFHPYRLEIVNKSRGRNG